MYNMLGYMKDNTNSTLASLILAVIETEPLHGYAIAKRIKERSEEALEYGEGTLYPALKKLHSLDLVESSWQTDGTGPARKVYFITEKGRKQLAADRESWRKYVKSFSLVLGGQNA